MAKNKLQKFAEMYEYAHVYQNFSFDNPQLITKDRQEVSRKGCWNESHFKNGNPITLELACGKGDYAIGLARLHPDRNYIGVDVKGARMWRGARTVHEEKIPNVAFLRTRIELITEFFEAGEVDEIWITFPDPFPRDSDENNRLTSPMFLERYKKILKPGGRIFLKTDSDTLYQYTSIEMPASYDGVEILEKEDDIYSNLDPVPPELMLKTFYEQMHLENKKTIKYLVLKLKE